MKFIFNLRVWRIHFQIEKTWKIIPMFAWFDFWIGLFFDKGKRKIYIFPIPMFGIRTEGIWFHYNSHVNFKNDPFIWLFNIGDKYKPMRKYHNQ